ncbi:MAG: hypothetical protein ACREDO_11895 [Methyloceanibacter sp.]
MLVTVQMANTNKHLAPPKLVSAADTASKPLTWQKERKHEQRSK